MENEFDRSSSAHTSGSSFFSGLVIGSLVGAALAILMAPASGMQTRNRLRDTSEEVLDRSVRFTEEARDRAEAIVAEAQRKAQRMVDVARESVESGKQEMHRFVEKEKEVLQSTNTHL